MGHSAPSQIVGAFPAGIALRLPEWRRLLVQVNQARSLGSPEADRLQRELWAAVAAALAGIDGDELARALPAIATALRVSIPTLNGAVEVCRAFPEGLPARPWRVLRALAGLSEEGRRRYDQLLPLDAPESAIPRPAPAITKKVGQGA